jgi:hypothetical protein
MSKGIAPPSERNYAASFQPSRLLYDVLSCRLWLQTGLVLQVRFFADDKHENPACSAGFFYYVSMMGNVNVFLNQSIKCCCMCTQAIQKDRPVRRV